MKYELTDDMIIVGGTTLYRIKAVKDFGTISQGTLGGYIEKEWCLSHTGDAWVSGDARVYGDAWVSSPLFIVGSHHTLTNSKKGYIKIGCKEYTFAYWKKHFRTIGQSVGYSDEAIVEYKFYIDLFCKIGK